jgi:hypothetical protein
MFAGIVFAVVMGLGLAAVCEGLDRILNPDHELEEMPAAEYFKGKY